MGDTGLRYDGALVDLYAKPSPYTPGGFHVGVGGDMMRRTVTALNNLLRTQGRTLPAEDFATVACLRDTLAQTLASGKTCEGRLSTYE